MEANIALMLAILGALIGILNYVRTKKKDDQGEATSLTAVMADIRHIMAGIEEIKKDIKEDIKSEIKNQNDLIANNGKLIAVLDQGLKSAHHRIDELTKKVEGL